MVLIPRDRSMSRCLDMHSVCPHASVDRDARSSTRPFFRGKRGLVPCNLPHVQFARPLRRRLHGCSFDGLGHLKLTFVVGRGGSPGRCYELVLVRYLSWNTCGRSWVVLCRQ